ncbi:uncharacterized protein LOC120434301 isoform X2 [Oreochromis aureus]|uniref:uncharacterized protein LOC120434301 isoform X2 n=1 Tax=Oreochromis aureus TaxID=47969 RepID=UPI0019539859|nr:uncharacterized protein LOC120434301 isoform X2 [Oreochromis aureus]
MPSVQYLREFINERLTAAAEQIFLEFEKTIVQYEEEIDRQRRLLDITWKPQIKLHRTDVPQQHFCKEEEVIADQQLWNQERSSNLDQEEPEAPQIKEEQEQLCSSQEGEQLVLKEEIHTFMVTAAEERDHSEPEPKREQLNCVSSAVAVRQYQGGRKKDSESPRNKNQPTPDTTTSQNRTNTEKTCLINEINFFSILFHFRLVVCALVLDSNLSCLKVSYKNFKCASIILKINSSMERPVSDKINGNKIFILDLCFRRVQLYPVF